MPEFQDRSTELGPVGSLDVSSEVIGGLSVGDINVAESAAHLSPGSRRALIPISVLQSVSSPMEDAHYQEEDAITRRRTHTTWVGSVPVGSEHQIVIQSMTNTDTANIGATVDQVARLAEAGSELVRVTVNNNAAAAAVPRIVDKLGRLGINVPIIGDFHFIGDRLLANNPDCAEALSKYRINPGNTGHRNDDAAFRKIVQTAIQYDKPVRIGVNWGSLDPQMVARLMDENAALPNSRSSIDVKIDAMVASAMESARLAEREGLPSDRIILSAKISRVQNLIKVYGLLADQPDNHYPLHLGLTEAGMGEKAIVASTAALSVLLQQGIGDTIRVSLTPSPDGDRTEEVRISRQILQSLDIRRFTPEVTSCPGCGRASNTFYQEVAERVQQHITDQMPVWDKRYPGVENMRLAVMGCVVNGPGEARDADLAISLPGLDEKHTTPVYLDGKPYTTLEGEDVIARFLELMDKYVDDRWG